MRELYVDGDTLLHRISADIKIITLIVFGVGIFLTDNLTVLAAPLALAALCYVTLPFPLKQAIFRLFPIAAAIVLVGVFNLIFIGWQPAALTVMRLTALMLAGAAITAATPIPDFIDTITRWATPLEKAGLLKAADIGLAVGLVIRFVPDILSRYDAIRDAQRARGIRLRPIGIIVPLIILTLRDADIIANAIDARGIRGQAVKKGNKRNDLT